jgi:hypothetical protein
MTPHVDSMAAELAALRAEVDDLRAAVGTRDGSLPTGAPAKRGRARRVRQRVAVGAGIALVAAAMMGVAVASSPGNPADVTYIPLSVPHKILSGTSIGHGAVKAAVVVGGSTTVPTDATSVQMTVAVKSTAAGSLSVFPTDHPSSSTADTINFPAGSVLVSQVSKQSPGLSSKVSFQNNGSGTAIVTVTITGYSTQTTASNISGAGGSAGQVLTNDGIGGASWQSLNFQSPDVSTVTVHPGSTPAISGTRLIAAVSAISATPTLVRLEPGRYDLGSSTLNLPSGVWIEGAGQGLTTIAGSAFNVIQSTGNTGLELLTVSGPGTDCVRQASAGTLTVQLVEIGGCSYGIESVAPASVSVVRTSINVSGGRGVDLTAGGTATIDSSTIVDTGAGSGIASVSNASVQVSDSTVTGGVFGLFLTSSTAVVWASQITGTSSDGLHLVGSSTSVANSMVANGVFNTGTLRCVGDYNATYVALSSTCT